MIVPKQPWQLPVLANQVHERALFGAKYNSWGEPDPPDQLPADLPIAKPFRRHSGVILTEQAADVNGWLVNHADCGMCIGLWVLGDGRADTPVRQRKVMVFRHFNAETPYATRIARFRHFNAETPNEVPRHPELDSGPRKRWSENSRPVEITTLPGC